MELSPQERERLYESIESAARQLRESDPAYLTRMVHLLNDVEEEWRTDEAWDRLMIEPGRRAG
jgi:hypothetical protein